MKVAIFGLCLLISKLSVNAGFGVLVLGFEVQCLGFRVRGWDSGVWSLGLRDWDLVLGVKSLGFEVWGLDC